MALLLEDDVRDEGYDTKLKRESIELCHSERTNVQRTEDNYTKCMESHHERFVNKLVRDLEQHEPPHGRVPKHKLSSTKSYKFKRRRPALGLVLKNFNNLLLVLQHWDVNQLFYHRVVGCETTSLANPRHTSTAVDKKWRKLWANSARRLELESCSWKRQLENWNMTSRRHGQAT